MGRFLVALMAFALVVFIIKLVIVALVIAGLIFRPRETIGLLLIGGWSTLTSNHPVIGIGLLVLFIVGAIITYGKKAAAPALDDPDQK